MFSVVIMSNQNGGKSQKQSGIALRRLRTRLLSVIENFSPATFWTIPGTLAISLWMVLASYTLLHLPGMVQAMESILMSLLQ